MTPGIYALASLDGAPLELRDAACLGLAPRAMGDIQPATADSRVQSPGLLALAHDPQPAAIHVHRTGGTVTLLAGYLDEPVDLARTLGLPSSTATAALAEAALLRYATDAPLHLLGEWSLLRWEPASRRLTVMVSEATRDNVYFATNGLRVAVSPDISKLQQLPWVGTALDPEGFALNLGRASVRSLMKQQTCWRNVLRVEAGATETFTGAGRTSSPPCVLPAIADVWQGSFEDAVQATEDVLQRIVMQHLQRAGRSAGMLSGGLDSSLLAALAGRINGPGAEFFAVSSVAAESSGLPDERNYSTAVAKQSNLAIYLVPPALDANVYRPWPEWYRRTQRPAVSVRHYVYEALLRAAAAHGAIAVIDGVQGEHSITHKPRPGSQLSVLRRWRFQLILWMRNRAVYTEGLQNGFHVRLSQELLGVLPASWERVASTKFPVRGRVPRGMPVGLDPATRKSSGTDTAALFGVRHMYPFRDQRLIRLAASFPSAFYTHNGETRAIAREILRGKVPEQVRLRRESMPFSPEHVRLLQAQAPETMARMPLFAEAGAGRWLDLPWLEQALGQIAAGNHDTALQMQAQQTAIAAEFFLLSQI